MDDTDQKLKSGHHPLFIPNVPFISPSRRLCEPEATIPLFHWVSNDKHHPYGVKSKPGPLGHDSLLEPVMILNSNGIHKAPSTLSAYLAASSRSSA
jgi:hypothetical protein